MSVSPCRALRCNRGSRATAAAGPVLLLLFAWASATVARLVVDLDGTCLMRGAAASSDGAAACPDVELRRHTEGATAIAMPKALHFKGDKKTKKRRQGGRPYDAADAPPKALAAPAADAGNDDSWVTADAPSDVSGPVVLALPTDTPACLACDANGKVFASALENIVDSDPTTAEPHDVRQVWVANRVAGTDSLSLKGHHGR